MDSKNLAWAVVAVIVAIILVGIFVYYPPNAPTPEKQGFVPSPPPREQDMLNLTSPMYGEDNPIVVHQDRIRKGYIDGRDVAIANEIENHLFSKGHLTTDDVSAHSAFISKNSSKMARSSANRVVSEMREVTSPYIGGNRAMTMMPIVRPEESRVPDRVMAPIRSQFYMTPPNTIIMRDV